MAYVTKDGYGRSPFWLANYRDASGRKIRKSTRLTSKSKALEMARGLEKAANEARRGVLTESRTRELLGEILQTVNGGDGMRFFTVADWLEHFAKGKRKSRSERTAEIYSQTTCEFLEFLGNRAKLNVAAITSRDIAGFRDARAAKGFAPPTVNLAVKILSAAFNAALRQGHITVNPCLAVEPLKDKPQRKGIFSPEQVTALLATASGDWRGLILAGFYTGQRLADLANLRWRNVDLVSDIKTIRLAVRKTGREIVTVVHPALEDYLLALPTPDSDDKHIFPTLAERVSTLLSQEFSRIMKAARIEQRVIRQGSGHGHNVNSHSFHSLRHSFASILANAGVSEERRMSLVGHQSRDVHQIYSHHDLEALRDAIAVLPRI